MNINLAKLWAGQRGENSPVRLTGVRGANDAGGTNLFAKYDDLLIVTIDGATTQWPASTDPSWALVVHPINPAGAAQLCEGNHLFELHMMHGKYLCLGQAEDVHVRRLNSQGNVVNAQCGQFGICIHSGGDGMDTRRFSAGCQIIQNNDGYFQDPTWSRFFDPIHAAMKAHGLATVPYLLHTKADLQNLGVL